MFLKTKNCSTSFLLWIFEKKNDSELLKIFEFIYFYKVFGFVIVAPENWYFWLLLCILLFQKVRDIKINSGRCRWRNFIEYFQNRENLTKGAWIWTEPLIIGLFLELKNVFKVFFFFFENWIEKLDTSMLKNILH